MMNEEQTWAQARRLHSAFRNPHSAFAQRAFTLLELVLVLALLTLVVAMIAPSFRGFTEGRSTRNLATNLVTLTRYARTQAIAESRIYRLNYDAGNRELWLTYEAGAAFLPPENDFGRRMTVPEGLQLETDMPMLSDGQYVQFHPSGRADPATIRLTDSYGEVIEVACLSATEMFRIR